MNRETLQTARDIRLEETKGPTMSGLEDCRQVQASEIVNPAGLDAQSASVSPPIPTNQHHPPKQLLPARNTNQDNYLDSKPLPALPHSSNHDTGASPTKQVRNRKTVIINGDVIVPYAPHAAHEYRAIPFGEPAPEIAKRTVNVLTKPPPPSHGRSQLAGESRYGSRDIAVSESATVVRLEEEEEKHGVIAEPLLANGPFEVLEENREPPPQHPDVLTIRQPRARPVITVTCATPPTSSASALPMPPRTARGTGERQYQTADGVRIPPRRHHVIHPRNPKATATATPSPEQTSKAEEDEKERHPAAKFHCDCVRTMIELEAERQRRAAAEEQIVFLRARVSQKGAYGAHYQMMWEHEKKMTETLQRQLDELGEKGHALEKEEEEEAGRDDEDEVSHVNSDTSGLLGASVVFLPLRSSRGRPQLENIFPTPRFGNEAPVTISHGHLHPAAELAADEPNFPASKARYERLLKLDDGWVEPSSYFSDDSDSDSGSEMDESVDEEGSVYELPAEREPRTLSEEQLASSSTLCIRYSGIDLASTPAPTSPFPAPSLPELDSSPSTLEDTESESENGSENKNASESFVPPRPTEAIFRFDERRIQAVPAVFRVPIPKTGPGPATLPSSVVGCFFDDDAASMMDTWEWDSVPDLSLGDF